MDIYDKKIEWSYSSLNLFLNCQSLSSADSNTEDISNQQYLIFYGVFDNWRHCLNSKNCISSLQYIHNGTQSSHLHHYIQVLQIIKNALSWHQTFRSWLLVGIFHDHSSLLNVMLFSSLSRTVKWLTIKEKQHLTALVPFIVNQMKWSSLMPTECFQVVLSSASIADMVRVNTRVNAGNLASTNNNRGLKNKSYLHFLSKVSVDSFRM